MTTNTGQPWFQRILPDVLAFGLGLGTAYFLNWNTMDLVWSLWLCSLVLGYLTLLSAIGAGAYIGFQAVRDRGTDGRKRMPVILIGTAGGLFLLGFFSLHFCGFHAGHSVFLQSFFPVAGMPSDGFGRAFMNPPLLWALVFKHLMKPYGLFLIPAIIAERQHVFQPLIRALRAARGGPAAVPDDPPDKKRDLLGDAMGRPYLNVVRMHLLIFFFGFCHILKVDSFWVYAVVYTVYFFPWRELKEFKRPAIQRVRAD